ncbi:MAG: hypothetical protein IJG60_09560 [Thermoguttaceae bacterium]|nr:hypothetical protein [Thermoguttaceae bacterium]
MSAGLTVHLSNNWLADTGNDDFLIRRRAGTARSSPISLRQEPALIQTFSKKMTDADSLEMTFR